MVAGKVDNIYIRMFGLVSAKNSTGYFVRIMYSHKLYYTLQVTYKKYEIIYEAHIYVHKHTGVEC
jgi:hypothetical protein